MSEPDLNERQRKFVEGVATGLSVQQAAKQAAFSASYARKASRLLKNPSVRQTIEAIQGEARTVAAYSLLEAVRELDKAIAFGYAKGNPMSIAKLLEAKGRLFGLYVDRYQEVPLDLCGALEAARGRVVNITPPRQPCEDGLAVPGGARWLTPIPGNPNRPLREGE
jgi:hypothetical protein